MKHTFLIEYSLFDKSGKIFANNKQIKVKNKENKFTAQCSLEDYLKNKYPNFGSMIIHKCEENNPIIDTFNDLFGGFKK
jgi:hypothetical protein